MLNFQPITLKKQAEYLALFSKCPQKPSDYSFINLWGWAKAHGLSWAWKDELVWIRQSRPTTRLWAPIGAWDQFEWAPYFSKNFSRPVIFNRIPEVLLSRWKTELGDRLQFESTRGQWDYLYDATDLTSLKGNRFLKKRNLVNQFHKKYNFKYLPFETHLTQKTLDFQKDWCSWKDCESNETLASENQAIKKTLTSWHDLVGILGGVIMVEETLIAYTIGEKLDNTLVIHFEKGNPKYKGVYQAMNKLFLSHLPGSITQVNREQDLDLPGLRKAKLSYQPKTFIRKYRVVIHP